MSRCDGAGGKAKVRPALEGVTGFDGQADDPRGDQFVVADPGDTDAGVTRRRPEFGHDAPVRRHPDTLAGFDPADVATEVVLQIADACGDHA